MSGRVQIKLNLRDAIDRSKSDQNWPCSFLRVWRISAPCDAACAAVRKVLRAMVAKLISGWDIREVFSFVGGGGLEWGEWTSRAPLYNCILEYLL